MSWLSYTAGQTRLLALRRRELQTALDWDAQGAAPEPQLLRICNETIMREGAYWRFGHIFRSISVAAGEAREQANRTFQITVWPPLRQEVASSGGDWQRLVPHWQRKWLRNAIQAIDEQRIALRNPAPRAPEASGSSTGASGSSTAADAADAAEAPEATTAVTPLHHPGFGAGHPQLLLHPLFTEGEGPPPRSQKGSSKAHPKGCPTTPNPTTVVPNCAMTPREVPHPCPKGQPRQTQNTAWDFWWFASGLKLFLWIPVWAAVTPRKA